MLVNFTFDFLQKNTLMLRRYLSLLLFSMLMLACQEKAAPPHTFQVHYHGALKNMMHQGDISAKTDLADFKGKENLYALGAIENLKGEIQIFAGQSHLTQVVDSTIAFDDSFSKKATLLVYAEVEDWTTFPIAPEVHTYDQLEQFIEKTASDNGIPTNEAFPFLIQGRLNSMDWHVINWKDGDTEHSHQKHISSGLNGTLEKVTVELLGFYSKSHHAIFTHHTRNSHIHFKTQDGNLAGHLDDLLIGEGMKLSLPRIE